MINEIYNTIGSENAVQFWRSEVELAVSPSSQLFALLQTATDRERERRGELRRGIEDIGHANRRFSTNRGSTGFALKR